MATYLEYMDAALKKAEFEQCEDGSWFAFIPRFDGLWATGPSRESARVELWHTLDGWLDVHVKIGKLQPPDVDGISFGSPPKLVEE
jgi:predicted RNase H-like HicB family nuclease